MTDLKPGPELAACVAVEVMGWPRTQSTEEDWGKRPFVAEFTDREGGGINVYAVGNNNWRPDRDIAADYEVLQHVRKHWLGEGAGPWERFCEALWELQIERRRVGWHLLYDSHGLYEPGDYSLAALAATKPTTTD